jgi:hypothetical protein
VLKFRKEAEIQGLTHEAEMKRLKAEAEAFNAESEANRLEQEAELLRLSMHTQKTSRQQTPPEAGSMTQEEELRVKGVEALMMEEDGMDDDRGGMLFFSKTPSTPCTKVKPCFRGRGGGVHYLNSRDPL